MDAHLEAMRADDIDRSVAAVMHQHNELGIATRRDQEIVPLVKSDVRLVSHEREAGFVTILVTTRPDTGRLYVVVNVDDEEVLHVYTYAKTHVTRFEPACADKDLS